MLFKDEIKLSRWVLYYVYNTLCIILGGIMASVYEVAGEKYDFGEDRPRFPTNCTKPKWILLNSKPNDLFFIL